MFKIKSKRLLKSIKNKKAVTHIEMIVAMILFILSVFSVVIFFNFFNKALEINQNTLNILERNFLNQAGNFTKVDVFVLFPGSSQDCFNISLNPSVLNEQDKIGVFYNDTFINFSIENDKNIFIQKMGQGIYEIYSFNFNVSNSSNRINTADCTNAIFNYTLPLKKNIFSYSQLEEMNDSYYNDYNNLKNILDFQNDFSLIIKHESTILFNMTRQKSLKSEVYAKNFQINILDQNKRIINADVKIEVW